MTIDDKIKDTNLKHNINRDVVKVSEILSGNTDKQEYYTGEEILPSDQSRMIEQAKFTYSQKHK